MLHRLSTSFIRTLREDPADAEVASHRLLVRACYVRRAAPGVYTWLPLGLRTLRKIEDIVRQEMDAMGGQEVHFPALLPAEPYQATGRWDDYGPTLFKLRDRKDGDYLLAPTHEEMFTLAVKDLYSSYKDLPAIVYQIQTKYRDEARPRAGIIRGREFVMKDSYSFDIDDAGLAAAYQAHRDAYERIFARLGLDYVIVNAMAGAMGGSHSEEFLHPCEIGEDTFVRSSSGYAANAEAVTTVVPDPVDASGIGPARMLRIGWAMWLILGLLAAYQLVVLNPIAAVVVPGNLLLAVLAARLLTLTTPTPALLDALIVALRPLRFVGLNPERTALAVALMIRSIPYLLGLFDDARDAARARGAERNVVALLMPMVLGSVAHAERTGEALAARGLGERER